MTKVSAGNPEKYRPGEIYSFKTRPATRFSPPDTGRYGALKILGAVEGGAGVCFVLLDGVFTSPPGPAEVARLKVMRHVRVLDFESEFESLVVSSEADASADLHEFRLVAFAKVTGAERVICDQNDSHGGWDFAAATAERVWRERNDAKAYEAEYQRQEADDERIQAEQRHRQNTRLKKLTFAQLRSEPLLPSWNGDCPPADFTVAVRERILVTIAALETLGEKPSKPAVRTILNELMNWLNKEDENRGGPIETIEREDLCTVIEELCWAAKQPSLVKPMQDMRTW